MASNTKAKGIQVSGSKVSRDRENGKKRKKPWKQPKLPHTITDVVVSVHITTHIHDRLHAEHKQLLHKHLIAALTGRIYNECGMLGWEVADSVEDLFGVSDAKGHLMRESIQLRVVHHEAD
jgi:hypothetical protein